MWLSVHLFIKYSLFTVYKIRFNRTVCQWNHIQHYKSGLTVVFCCCVNVAYEGFDLRSIFILNVSDFRAKIKQGRSFWLHGRRHWNQRWLPRARKLLEPSSKDRCKVFALIKGEVFAHLKCSRFKDGGRFRIGFLLDIGLFILSQRIFFRQKSSPTHSSQPTAADKRLQILLLTLPSTTPNLD